jgi:hypothetical protein
MSSFIYGALDTSGVPVALLVAYTTVNTEKCNIEHGVVDGLQREPTV